MKSSLPLSNLHRITLLMTIVINLFVLVILLISRGATPVPIISDIIQCSILIYIMGWANIFILQTLQERSYPSYKTADWYRYALGIALSLTAYLILGVIFSFVKGEEKEILEKTRILTGLVAYAVFYTLISVVHDQVILQHSKNKAELENMQLKAAVSEASNFMLRQQIHPHFLFNSLTILKSLYKKDTVKGEFYLTRLASFLRASISDQSAKMTTLQAELMLCMDYMDMQKIRFGNALEYSVEVSQEVKVRFVPFFSIQVLLENAIKHNAMTDANPLKIVVCNNSEYITVENNLQIKLNKEVSTGQGLSNLAERYRLLSGDQLNIKQDKETFSVTIRTYENENSNY